MLGSPAPLISHWLWGVPGSWFSATIGFTASNVRSSRGSKPNRVLAEPLPVLVRILKNRLYIMITQYVLLDLPTARLPRKEQDARAGANASYPGRLYR